MDGQFLSLSRRGRSGLEAQALDDRAASGEIVGKRYGYAIFDHPSNLRHPVYWHSRTYGLLGTNPFAIQSFDRKAEEKGGYTLDEGKELTLRYRVLFHVGDEKEGKVAEFYAEYAKAK